MSKAKTLIDPHGQHYKLHIPGDQMVIGKLDCKQFSNRIEAQGFISTLDTPYGYWNEVVSRCGPMPMSCANMEDHISELLANGELKLYPVVSDEERKTSLKNRTFKTNDGKRHELIDASAKLDTDPSKIKEFSKKEEAMAYLSKLGADENQLKEMAKSLNLNLPTTATDSTSLSEIVATAMTAKQVVVVVDDASAPPRPQETTPSEGGSTAGNIKMDSQAGANVADDEQEENTEEQKEEKLPPCTAESFSLTCKHGRKIQVEKDKEGKTPRLAIVSTEKNKDEMDEITASFNVGEACGDHKGVFKVSSSGYHIGSNTINELKVKLPCGAWTLENAFERVWLPAVDPISYTISTNKVCEPLETKQLDVDVYPDIKWEWETSIDFGKLSFIPGKGAVTYSDFKFGEKNNVTLTYDGEPHDLKEKYKTYVEEPLEGFKKICDAVTTVLEVINDPKAALLRMGHKAKSPPPKDGSDNKDGNDSRLEILWPNLSFTYTSSFEENTDEVDLVDNKYSLEITAAPLLGIYIKVDVVNSIISAAKTAAPLAGALIEYAKKKIEQPIKEGANVGLRGELDIVFDVSSSITIEESKIIGVYNKNGNKITSEPIKGKFSLPATLKGEVRAEAKWFVLSYEKHYVLTGSTEWAGDFEIGGDDTGIYFSHNIEFQGVDITMSKYEELKVEMEANKELKSDFLSALDIDEKVETDNNSASVSAEDGKLDATLTEKSAEEWSWLKPERDGEKPTKAKEIQTYYLLKH